MWQSNQPTTHFALVTFQLSSNYPPHTTTITTITTKNYYYHLAHTTNSPTSTT